MAAGIQGHLRKVYEMGYSLGGNPSEATSWVPVVSWVGVPEASGGAHLPLDLGVLS